MAFCKNCGQQLVDGAAFCANCGTPVENAPQATTQAQASSTQQTTAPKQAETPVQATKPQQQEPPKAQEAVQQPQSATVSATVIGNGEPLPSEKGLAWLSYIPWTPLFLIPLFVRKTSEYCKFHVKQGATLWAVGIVYQIVKAILLAIINAIFPGRYGFYYYHHSIVYNIFDFILWGGAIFLFVLSIIGIVNAATGKKKDLPLIGKIPWIGMLLDKIYAGLNKNTGS